MSQGHSKNKPINFINKNEENQLHTIYRPNTQQPGSRQFSNILHFIQKNDRCGNEQQMMNQYSAMISEDRQDLGSIQQPGSQEPDDQNSPMVVDIEYLIVNDPAQMKNETTSKHLAGQQNQQDHSTKNTYEQDSNQIQNHESSDSNKTAKNQKYKKNSGIKCQRSNCKRKVIKKNRDKNCEQSNYQADRKFLCQRCSETIQK